VLLKNDIEKYSSTRHSALSFQPSGQYPFGSFFTFCLQSFHWSASPAWVTLFKELSRPAPDFSSGFPARGARSVLQKFPKRFPLPDRPSFVVRQTARNFFASAGVGSAVTK